MIDKRKTTVATRRIQNRNKPVSRPSFIRRCWNAICNFCRKVWNFICNIDLVGLLNLVLLVVIIVLFMYLLLDMFRFRDTHSVVITKGNTTVVAKPVPVINTNNNADFVQVADDARIIKETILPISRDSNTKKYERRPVNVAQCKNCKRDSQLAVEPNNDKKMYGDIIVDNRCTGAQIKNGTEIKGNLYLQDMRKYTLPCDIKIEGNLFLRDVNLLQFCGDFTVTGNIYVSPRSSFGPIPSTARLGGQVIL